MSLEVPGVVDTRLFFRPVSSGLVTLLRELPLDGWDRQTVAGTWVVRDVVAHLLDSTLRRLSFHRDAMAPPAPARAMASKRDFVAYINDLNGQWVGAARRLSPRVLMDLYQRASSELADWFESLPLDAPALFAVSWAGEQTSAGWFDVGREFTELWHHQQQIRMAVGAGDLPDPRYLHAVIDIAVRGLPHALRDVPEALGATIAIEIAGPSGGTWTLRREHQGWSLWSGDVALATTRVRLSDTDAWKLLFNALSEPEAESATRIEGRVSLGRAALRARSVIV